MEKLKCGGMKESTIENDSFPAMGGCSVVTEAGRCDQAGLVEKK